MSEKLLVSTVHMVVSSDVTKLVKIRIRKMQILTFNIRQMWMRIKASILLFGT